MEHVTKVGGGDDLKAAAYPDPRYGYYVTFILLLAYTLSFVDRQILSFMVDPVKRDLQLSDTSISLLHGFAFSLFYTAVGLFLGRAADRLNRRRLMIAGVSLWCAATVACGFADSYAELFAGRMLVGVGEAALSPAAYSLLSDYFSEEKRARPIGLYSAGVYIGSGLAFMVGGAVVEAASHAGNVSLGVLGDFRPWQLAFIIVGLPGLLMVLLLLTVKEATRKDLGGGDPGLAFFRDNARFYLPAILGFAILAIVTFAFTAWIPAAFARTWGWSPARIGLAYGATMLLAGGGGMIFAGWLADHQLKRDRVDAPIRLSLIAALAAIPIGGGLAFAASPVAAMTLVGITTFLVSVPIALAPVAFQNVTPNRLRGQATALYLLMVNLIGMGCGPTLVALVTDVGFRDESKVLLSVSIVGASSMVLAAALIGLAVRPYRSLHRARAEAMKIVRYPFAE